MGLDELKEKYRSLPIWARILMALIFGILPGACSYLDEVETVEASLTDAENKESSARNQFEANRKEKANIPKLEEELVYTEEQLEKAKRKLPEGYLMENVLALTAGNAKASGVKMKKFEPLCELKGVGEFKYVERMIDVEVNGKYQQISSFFDRMVHSESLLFLREIDIDRAPLPGMDVLFPVAIDVVKLPPTQLEVAEKSRLAMTLNAKFKLVIFRGMKDEESVFFEYKNSCADDAVTIAAAMEAAGIGPDGKPLPLGPDGLPMVVGNGAAPPGDGTVPPPIAPPGAAPPGAAPPGAAPPGAAPPGP